ncbi:MAG: glucose-6-phosphate isomerase [Ruminococcaceae bacterium]|nr:glucose-6-phosphate isomerase [Oscillospiraceae bacterium]
MSVKLNKTYLEGFISENEYSGVAEKVKEAVSELEKEIAKKDGFAGWASLPANYDREEFRRIKEAAKKIRSDSDILVVVGIGGSYLGARAVIELLGGEFVNEGADLKVLYAGNNISGDYLLKILEMCEGKRLSVNVISKSGVTLEPAIAFRAFKKLMEDRYGEEEAAKRIYVTTDAKKGALKGLSDVAGYETFVVPDDIGGRYSVLTAVGLLPIAAAGFDIDALMAGAKNAMELFAEPDLEKNPCYEYASIRYMLEKQGKKIELLTCFEPAFNMFGEWYKQLYGESEGKDGKGLFPASLNYSTDLHSMGQYVQDGQRILFETLLRFEKTNKEFTVEYIDGDFDGLNYIAGKTMSYINHQASEGVMLAHNEGKVPVMIIESEKRDEFNAGELIYFFEKACAVSGYMLGVYPFDQPGVEQYKKNMFALLGKPGYNL